MLDVDRAMQRSSQERGSHGGAGLGEEQHERLWIVAGALSGDLRRKGMT